MDFKQISVLSQGEVSGCGVAMRLGLEGRAHGTAAWHWLCCRKELFLTHWGTFYSHSATVILLEICAPLLPPRPKSLLQCSAKLEQVELKGIQASESCKLRKL